MLGCVCNTEGFEQKLAWSQNVVSTCASVSVRTGVVIVFRDVTSIQEVARRANTTWNWRTQNPGSITIARHERRTRLTSPSTDDLWDANRTLESTGKQWYRQASPHLANLSPPRAPRKHRHQCCNVSPCLRCRTSCTLSQYHLHQ